MRGLRGGNFLARVGVLRASCNSASMLKSVRHRVLQRTVQGDCNGFPPEHAARIVHTLRELDIGIT